MGEVPGCNSIPKSTTLCGGSQGSSSGKISTYTHTTRGRSKSGLPSSSRVRLASQWLIRTKTHILTYNTSVKGVLNNPWQQRHTLLSETKLNIHKFIPQSPKDYELIPGNGTIKLVDLILYKPKTS